MPTLTCPEVRMRLYPLVLRALGERDRVETLEHTQVCDACGGELLAVRARLERIQGLPAAEPEERQEPSETLRGRLWMAVLPALLVALGYAFLLRHVVAVGQEAEERAFQARLNGALALYERDHGFFPPQSGLPLPFYLGGQTSGRSLDLDAVRLDAGGSLVDTWGRHYVYRFPGTHNPRLYDLQSLGPNGRDDGGRGDDLANW